MMKGRITEGELQVESFAMNFHLWFEQPFIFPIAIIYAFLQTP